MFGFFEEIKPKKPTNPTDTIVPIHYFDDNAINRSVLLYITLRFDDVLDPDKLRQGFERLMEIGDWRKLGARVRKTQKDGLEYHVPTKFDADRPGFGCSHEVIDSSIHVHPLASRLPRSTDEVSIYSDLDGLSDLARRHDGPKKLADFLDSDEPQLSLHIVTFQDATLVSISWCHTFMDAMALSGVLRAWVLVLNGRESEVPLVCNFVQDPLATFGTVPTEPYVHVGTQLSGYNFFVFSIRYIWDLIIYRDAQRLVYLPSHLIQSMKASALQDLNAEEGDSMTGNKITPFLSDGDIICSFITRLIVKNLPPSTRQIAIMNAFDLRTTLAAHGNFPSTSVLLSNAVFTITALASAADIAAKSLAFTASRVRQSITEQGTYAQLDALAALQRKAVDSTGRPPVFGDGTTSLVIFSNWTKAKFFELDFGAAVVGDSVTVSKPSFVNLTGESDGLSPRGAWPILGKDQSGGYWMLGNLRSDLWEGVEKELKALAGEPKAG